MQKDDATWLMVGYVGAGLLAFYVGSSAVNMLGIQMGWVERYDEWYPFAQFGAGLLIGVGFPLYLKKDKERHEYFLASIAEVRKVTWPSWPDVKRMTIIVGVVVAIFGAILGIFDFGFSKLLSIVLA